MSYYLVKRPGAEPRMIEGSKDAISLAKGIASQHPTEEILVYELVPLGRALAPLPEAIYDTPARPCAEHVEGYNIWIGKREKK